jgi:hypothetical protein
MADDTPEIDPETEARKIVNKYLSEIGWPNEMKKMATGQALSAADWDIKFRQTEEMELAADENLGAEVDRLRAERSKISRAVLSKILELLGKRSDLTFFAKRMVNRIKEELK